MGAFSMSIMKKLFKEPLVHFMLIGVLIFLVYGIVGENETNENTIVFNSYDLNNILSKWELQWKRPPTEQELKNIIEQNMKQELFYQEALKMNLDHNDEIIKRRLSQKMEFLSNDLISMKPPTEQELLEFYEKEQQNYLSDYIFTLHIVTYSYDYHEQPSQVASTALEKAKESELSTLKGKGDKMSFPDFFENSEAIEIRKSLGNSFVEGLKKSTINRWSGPIQSGFGYHLVFITNKNEPRAIPLETIEDRVLNDYNYTRQRQLDSTLYMELKKHYTFDLDLNSKEFDPEIIKLVENTLTTN